MIEDGKITVPQIDDNLAKLYINDKFVGNISDVQLAKLTDEISEYIEETGDTSILNTFYLIGHDEYDYHKEIKVHMEKNGRLTDRLWEFSHVQRYLFDIMRFWRTDREFFKH